MAHYIIDIEVEKAVEADYLKLTSELTKSLFKQESEVSLLVNNRTSRRVFSKISESGLVEVNNEIKRAAEVIGKKYSYFIVKRKLQQVASKNKNIIGAV